MDSDKTSKVPYDMSAEELVTFVWQMSFSAIEDNRQVEPALFIFPEDDDEILIAEAIPMLETVGSLGALVGVIRERSQADPTTKYVLCTEIWLGDEGDPDRKECVVYFIAVDGVVRLFEAKILRNPSQLESPQEQQLRVQFYPSSARH